MLHDTFPPKSFEECMPPLSALQFLAILSNGHPLFASHKRRSPAHCPIKGYSGAFQSDQLPVARNTQIMARSQATQATQATQEAIPSSRHAAEKSPAFRFAFLQIAMQKGYLLDTDARALYRRICNVGTDAAYFEFLREVNQQLGYAHFELRRIKYPGDQQEYIGFVNREADEDSKKAGKYRGKDGKPDVRLTAFFRALLEKIATEEGEQGSSLGHITSGDALNLKLTVDSMTQQGATQGESSTQAAQARALQELGKRDRELALGEFVADGWLAPAPGRPGCYTLGVRSLLELGEYILSLDLAEGTRAALTNIL